MARDAVQDKQANMFVSTYSVQRTTEASVMQLNQPVSINFHINPAHGWIGNPEDYHQAYRFRTEYDLQRSAFSLIFMIILPYRRAMEPLS